MSDVLNIKAHPTRYAGVLFRSRLEARWAAFFDLCGWKWEYEPIDLRFWVPDFFVSFPCRHSECSGSHELYVEVKPYWSIAEFDSHPCRQLPRYDPPHPAVFGLNPEVTEWEMVHGAGGGVDWVPNWAHGWKGDWRQAGNLVQWRP